ncbi:MAG TPA: SAM-dependent methyltransferase [Streptosporangiaceae bacterium]|jgi:hypothetical protein
MSENAVTGGGGQDWARWHEYYDDPASGLSQRLNLVQGQLGLAISAAPAGPVSLLSLCAGQGRDVLGVLPDHPRRDDVAAVLVELDPANAASARDRAGQAGLASVEVRTADAGQAANYADAFPADVLLLCGIFGNVSATDIHRTVRAAAAMCKEGGTVLWTRHRGAPDFTGQIRAWFAEAGFAELAFEAPPEHVYISLGANRLDRAGPEARVPAGRLFTFRAG